LGDVHEQDQAHSPQRLSGNPQRRRAEDAGQFFQGVGVEAGGDGALAVDQ
jgi:hypothetical protein